MIIPAECYLSAGQPHLMLEPPVSSGAACCFSPFPSSIFILFVALQTRIFTDLLLLLLLLPFFLLRNLPKQSFKALQLRLETWTLHKTQTPTFLNNNNTIPLRIEADSRFGSNSRGLKVWWTMHLRVRVATLEWGEAQNRCCFASLFKLWGDKRRIDRQTVRQSGREKQWADFSLLLDDLFQIISQVSRERTFECLIESIISSSSPPLRVRYLFKSERERADKRALSNLVHLQFSFPLGSFQISTKFLIPEAVQNESLTSARFVIQQQQHQQQQ